MILNSIHLLHQTAALLLTSSIKIIRVASCQAQMHIHIFGDTIVAYQKRK
jgi:hypothetical protein